MQEPPASDAPRVRPTPSDPDEGWTLVSVIVKPFRLNAVLNALKPFHVEELMISQVRGYGRQKGHLELYSGAEYVVSFIPKLQIEFAAPLSEVPELVQAVRQAARTGRIGDGKIFVRPGSAVIDIAAGESV